jgi:hypothetical protein
MSDALTADYYHDGQWAEAQDWQGYSAEVGPHPGVVRVDGSWNPDKQSLLCFFC